MKVLLLTVLLKKSFKDKINPILKVLLPTFLSKKSRLFFIFFIFQNKQENDGEDCNEEEGADQKCACTDQDCHN